MNDLLERLFALDSRQRLAVYGVTFLLVILFFWWFFYSPVAAEVAEKRERVAQLEQERDTKVRRAARLEAFRQEVRELDARLNQAVAQLPDQKEIPELLSSVSSVGRDSGLDILLFRQRPEVFHEFYAEVPVEMGMRGTYRKVAAFLDAVGELDRIVNVNNISMKSPNVTPDEVLIDTNCTIVTFRFLTEEERKRIAAQKEREKKRR